MSDLSIQVRQVLVETFKLNESALPTALDADTIPAWDSLGHMGLILKLQEKFAVDIPHNEAIEMLSEDDIIAALNRLTENAS